MQTQVAVVGGGVMGLATGAALERAGVDAVVLEQFEVGHDRGSSHGATRIFRYLYDDSLYVRMAQASLPMWEALGTLEMTGGIQVDDPTVLRHHRDAMRECGADTEILRRTRQLPVSRGSIRTIRPSCSSPTSASSTRTRRFVR